jgi:uncharacterized membrane protein YjgN (DUF898 family)
LVHLKSHPLPVEAAWTPQTEPTDHRFVFTGRAGEYFRIWIVNLALSVVTLGIYSAWASVRTRSYFYANTWLAGQPFSYHARPVTILIGRTVAVGTLGAYLFASHFAPALIAPMLLLITALIPLLMVRALRFRARCSAWRGLRFRFVGTYREAYKYYLFAYLLAVLSFGFLIPRIKAWQKQYFGGGHRLGSTEVHVDTPRSRSVKRQSPGGAAHKELASVYVMAYVKALGIALLSPIPLFIGAVFAHAGFETAALLGGLAFYAVLYMSGLYLHTQITNGMYNHATIGPHCFRSTLSAARLFWIHATSSLAIIASVGLAIPWAKIRLARYRASCLRVIGPSEFEHLAAEAGEERAIGAEIGEAFGVDIGL